jgi:hypothetical protein
MTLEIRPCSLLFGPRMRTFATAAAFAVLSACAPAHSTSATGPVEVRVAGSGAYATAEARHAVLAVDSATYERELDVLIGETGELPPIDFETESAVILVADKRNTGGYWIDVRGARADGETLHIDAVVQGPPPGGMATQAITTPWTVVAVKGRTFRTVKWE